MNSSPAKAPIGERWARRLICSASGEVGDLDAPAFLSSAGKPWLVDYELNSSWGPAWAEALRDREWTLWRYRELLPTLGAPSASLGEGGTPLIPVRRLASLLPAGANVPAGLEVLVKEEGGNPTGSFKARGLSLAVHRAQELGAPGVELASAGNAALALAAYAAAIGLPARVAMPEDTPPVIAERCRLLGAEVLESPGTSAPRSRQRSAITGGVSSGIATRAGSPIAAA